MRFKSTVAAIARFARRLLNAPDKKGARELLGTYRTANHYYENLFKLLELIDASIEQSWEDQTRWPMTGDRILLDVEKMLSDTRSFIDAVFQLVLHCHSPECITQIPRTRLRSFGSFAEWWFDQDNPPAFGPPLSFLCELVPWGLTIRGLRDNYIHYGYEGMILPSPENREVYFDVNWQRRMNQPGTPRTLPEEFYVRNNANKIIYLDKLIVYMIAPVCALDQALGHYLDTLPESAPVEGFRPSSYRVAPRLRKLLLNNKDILNPMLYRARLYFYCPANSSSW